jgi:hypothetical protein
VLVVFGVTFWILTLTHVKSPMSLGADRDRFMAPYKEVTPISKTNAIAAPTTQATILRRMFIGG